MTYAKANRGNRYADEGLLQFFGATNIQTADASAYEGAEIVHDFNDPVPLSLHQRFDTVFDAGSLEHIFNIPCAVGNEMNMVKVGGRLLSTLPANNWLGHGFYQFSQEFPYRVFTPSNGFNVARAYFSGMVDNHELFLIDDLHPPRRRRDRRHRGAERPDGHRSEIRPCPPVPPLAAAGGLPVGMGEIWRRK